MSFNKSNNPNAMDKIMGYIRQISTEMGPEQVRRSGQDEEEQQRLYRPRGSKYARVPSKPTLSASTTCTSLTDSCGSQATLAHNTYAVIPEQASTDSSEEDEQETFEKTRRHFQQLRQISLGNEYKYKMEMEIKSAKDENLRNSMPFVKQLSIDSDKVIKDSDYAINGDSSPYHSTVQPLYIYTQLLAALAVSLGSMMVGFTSGYTATALLTMEREPTNVTSLSENATELLLNATNPHTPLSGFTVTKEDESWIGALMPLAALFGGISGGPLIEIVGRRNSIFGIGIPLIISYLIIANAFNIYMIFAGRIIAGFCIGIGSLAFPVYLGETAQPEVRGTLGLLPTALGNIGILLSYGAGAVLNWWKLAYMGAILPILFLILTCFIPETPRWYLNRGNFLAARKSLQWLRGKNANIEREMKELTRSQNKSDSQGGGSGIGVLFSRMYLRSVLVALFLMFFQQFSGINAVIFYAGKIFKDSGSTINESLCSIIIGIVNFASTFVATALIDRAGRKILLYISAVSMLLTLIILGAFFYIRDNAHQDVSAYGWVPLVCLVIYVIGFSLGLGPIPWLMLGEILPAKIRGTAASVATAFNWTSTFIVTLTFDDLNRLIGPAATFWSFGFICAVAIFFVKFFVPETRGKSLEEIESKMTGQIVRRRSSAANIKPMPTGC